MDFQQAEANRIYLKVKARIESHLHGYFAVKFLKKLSLNEAESCDNNPGKV